MQCVVLRKISGPGGSELLPGEIIDAGEYRNAERLIQQNRLRVATPDEIANAVEVDETFTPIVKPPVVKVAKRGKGK